MITVIIVALRDSQKPLLKANEKLKIFLML